jgi:hypothetical protein
LYFYRQELTQKTMKKIFLFVVLVFSLTSCQKTVYLTGSLMHTLQENELDLAKIQFYNDNPLVLEREVPSSNANIKSGKVFFKNGRYINRISLDKNTPGWFSAKKMVLC